MKATQALCIFHWLTLLPVHQLAPSCQNWFIRTNVKLVKTCVKFIQIILLNHKTGNQCFLINSEVTQNTAISLAIIMTVWFLQFLLTQTVHKSSFPLLSPVMASRWNHSDDIYSRFREGFLFVCFLKNQTNTTPKLQKAPLRTNYNAFFSVCPDVKAI